MERQCQENCTKHVLTESPIWRLSASVKTNIITNIIIIIIAIIIFILSQLLSYHLNSWNSLIAETKDFDIRINGSVSFSAF